MSPVDDPHDDVGAMIRATAARVEAPASLRAHVAGLQAEKARPRPRRRLAPAFAGIATAAAVLAVALVLVVGGSSTSGPTLADAATYALRPALGPAPAHQPASVELTTAIDGVAFPYWGDAFRLRATGARHDSINGRRAITVDYTAPDGDRVGYTILATPPLSVPGSARGVERGKTRFALWRRDGANVVTWRRAGHTCVLASRDLSAQQLLALAAWTGNGRVSGYAG